MPSSVNWPVMGGPTAHPTGVTLASDDPLKSLNAPGGEPWLPSGAGSSRTWPLGGPWAVSRAYCRNKRCSKERAGQR